MPDMSRTDAPLVLVADDNALTVRSLSMLFELEGYRVATAADGEEALRQARRLRPQVMLLDIGMPLLDGHSVARSIRAEPWGAGVLLIALTGWARTQDRDASIEAGFDVHLGKPLNFEDILAHLPGVVRSS